ncbi:Galactose oxidase [Purpureocillium takamizusanense]|uniref:Galactose oxidase n=1 Tax=Purpureocillium takamizusanense TaxID=2060973 RepID=A0A9Q8QS64_9HYPO|nr:Galactose oxidase [Purpureocillium takamizusanense]UNI23759.1 Galactose oxidase [Purpureocillium takamizusanense]
MKLLNAACALALCDAASLAYAAAVKPRLTSRATTLSLLAAKPLGNTINRAGWKVTCDSQEKDNECAKAIDGDQGTMWHTAWSDNEPSPPHTITVDMGSAQVINGISVLPRQDDNDHGWIARHDVFVSADGQAWGDAVVTGTWYSDKTTKYANFEPRNARYVRLVARSEANGQPWTSIAEFNVYKASNPPAAKQGVGKWGLTIDFPIVPVAAIVDPLTGKVVVWSAYENDKFEGSPGGWTLTSTWDPKTGEVTQRNVTNIGHDMFCPGISLASDGRVVVTGGSNAEKTSFYDSPTDSWVKGPDMNVPRGYQASTLTSDGRVFTIGGSWSGGVFEKNGEIWDPATNTWRMLPGAAVKPMLTKDRGGLYRSDNHAWLFGWHNGSVFQAGPSQAMNWYYPAGNGNTRPGGYRRAGSSVDGDAMCGNAVMFDAVAGKILTMGGAPHYEDADASSNAYVLTLGEKGAEPQVVFAGKGLSGPRIFANAVVLPDGTVFVTGGQRHGQLFHDTTPQLTPELYDPATDSFVDQAPNSVVRVYHSMAILLPDATVLSGGGGLCGGDCEFNHFDAQIFTPRYLLDAQGKPATRPVIRSVSSKEIRAGGRLNITTDGPIKSASMVRYGSATHSINTDQRRVPLVLQQDGGRPSYTVEMDEDLGVLLPGYWMLFVMNDKGVPSIATTIKVWL